jgi:hypothetical protein
MRRSGRTAQRCGSGRRRGLPGAMAHKEDDKRRRCEAYLLAQVLDGFAMTRQQRRCGGIDGGGGKLGLGFWWRRRTGARRLGHGLGRSRVAALYKGQGTWPWRVGHARRTRTRRRIGLGRGVRPGHGRSGMSAGPQLSSTASEGGGGAGWRWRCGPAGPQRELGWVGGLAATTVWAAVTAAAVRAAGLRKLGGPR